MQYPPNRKIRPPTSAAAWLTLRGPPSRWTVQCGIALCLFTSSYKTLHFASEDKTLITLSLLTANTIVNYIYWCWSTFQTTFFLNDNLTRGSVPTNAAGYCENTRVLDPVTGALGKSFRMALSLFHSIWNNIVSNLPQYILFCKNDWKSGGAILRVIWARYFFFQNMSISVVLCPIMTITNLSLSFVLRPIMTNFGKKEYSTPVTGWDPSTWVCETLAPLVVWPRLAEWNTFNI